MKFRVLILQLIISMSIAEAQSVAINTDGSTPNGSAMLDIKNPNKGLLIPRVSLISETDVGTIVNPLTSLLIYNTNNALPDGEGFYFWNGSKWSKLATRTNIDNLTWGIKGNTGTDAVTDFIGTTDNKALVFKTNNILSGKIDPVPNNTFFGHSAGLNMTGGANNSFFGQFAGISTTTGLGNLFAGHNAGASNTSGNGNVYLGQGAGKNIIFGNENIFIGEDAGFNSVFADGIVAIGHQVMHEGFLIGGHSTAVGNKALFSGGGFGNTAVGYKALHGNSDGAFNTGVGEDVLLSNTTGSLNTAYGDNALSENISGNSNTAVGVSSGPGIGFGTLNNTTAIGANAHVSTGNTMVFGDANVDRWAFGLTTTSAQHALEVGNAATNGNGAFLTQGGVWTNTSSKIKKEDFSAINGSELLKKIMQMPVQRWKYKGTNEYHIGPVAEDFYKLFGLGVDDKGISTVDPAGIALAAIQEQQKIIDRQNELILQLQKRVEILEKK